MDVSDLETIVSAVLASKKYHAVCEDTIRRIAGRELESHRNLRAAAKATRRRLHQIYGAFEGSLDYATALDQLRAAYDHTVTESEAKVRSACSRILSLHASTRERLPILDDFYASIFQMTGRPTSILDLGCGLNPLTLPWMGLAPRSRYIALDIDISRVRFLNRYLELAGMEPLARCQDILVHPPHDLADIALLLKMSPSLERQAAGATGFLIERLQAPFIVVSFSVRSLGGRKSGMLDHYQRQIRALAEERRLAIEQLVFGTELVFVIEQDRNVLPRQGTAKIRGQQHGATDRRHGCGAAAQ